MKKNIFFIILISILFLKCEKAETYSEIPEIKYTRFNVIEGDGDYTVANGILTFSFVDGDGDIGFGENKDTTLSQEYDIFICEYYFLNDTFTLNDTINYWMPYFEEGIYRESIMGSIDVILPQTILSPDTIRYEFYILDRAGHKSNIEVTPEIIYSELLKQ